MDNMSLLQDRFIKLINELSYISENPDMFKARMEALCTAAYLNQRAMMDNSDKDTQMTALLQDIQSNSLLGETPMPKGEVTPNSVRVAITDRLIRDMPASLGEAGFYMTQQIVDFYELRGWVDDVRAMGLQPTTTPRSIARSAGMGPRELEAAKFGIVK